MFRTAGTALSTFQTFSSDARSPDGNALFGRPDLEDDVGPRRQDLLGAGLDGLHLDVGEHVGTARHVEHVVEEAGAAARVEAAQRQPLAAEDEQRARAGPALDARADILAAPARCRRRRSRAFAASPVRSPSDRIVVVTSARPA